MNLHYFIDMLVQGYAKVQFEIADRSVLYLVGVTVPLGANEEVSVESVQALYYLAKCALGYSW